MLSVLAGRSAARSCWNASTLGLCRLIPKASHGDAATNTKARCLLLSASSRPRRSSTSSSSSSASSSSISVVRSDSGHGGGDEDPAVPAIRDAADPPGGNTVRLSKLLSHNATNLTLSRRQAERLIQDGEVTYAGRVVRTPQLLIDVDEVTSNTVLKVQGRAVLFEPSLGGGGPHDDDDDDGGAFPSASPPLVWAVHKVAGEVVAERDPHDRPSMMDRLRRGGVGRIKTPRRRGGQTRQQQPQQYQQVHLKPIGRLDMPTEGLILVTNDGTFAREMELPSSRIHRVYRVRVHGRLTSHKLERIRRGGVRHEDVRYPPMTVAVERNRGRGDGPVGGRGGGGGTNRPSSANTWVQITSTEGKNRQIRNVFAALGVTVTRLIRISYGDYKLDTIPPGMAIPVPYKPVANQRAKGSLIDKKKESLERRKAAERKEQNASPVTWVSRVQ